MLRFALLSSAFLALAASSSDSYQFSQRGTVATPRAALHDGQPMDGNVRLEGHMSTTADSAVEQTTASVGSPSGAAVAKSSAGGAVRFRANELVDFGVEVDSSWSPTRDTRDGSPIDGPDDAVIGVAVAVRGTTRPTAEGLRLGWVANLGAESAPIVRDNDVRVSRDEALLFRAALVPSLKRGAVTLFASLGLATETDVPATVSVEGSEDDPGTVHDAVGAVFAGAAGVSVDLGSGAHATARVGDAFTDNGNYGPQVDVGLAFDLGK
jgi:hypothetical protein